MVFFSSFAFGGNVVTQVLNPQPLARESNVLPLRQKSGHKVRGQHRTTEMIGKKQEQ